MPIVDRLRSGAGRRTLGLSLALLIEALLILALLSLGAVDPPGDDREKVTRVTLIANEGAKEAPEPSSPEREQKVERAEPQQQPETEQSLAPPAVEPQPAPPAPAIMPMPPARPAAPPSAEAPARPAAPAPSARKSYGPPNKGRSFFRDTERVGTAPNGEPLYAAAWYREPREDELRAYLSTARGPGWGLIACRTAPNYRVEDCVELDEYPSGSQISRAVVAAAWEFKVRPPQRGGQPLVGSWVRIRIDYGIGRR